MRFFVTVRRANRVWFWIPRKLYSRKRIYFYRKRWCAGTILVQTKAKKRQSYIDSGTPFFLMRICEPHKRANPIANGKTPFLKKNFVKFTRYLYTHWTIAVTMAHFYRGSHKMRSTRIWLIVSAISLIDSYRCQKINSHLRVASFYVSIPVATYM
jgi:hypothetical protein